MDNKYKGYMIITDLDGTLLSDEKTVAEEDSEAIIEFTRGGGTFAIATGRSFDAGMRYINLLGVTAPCILFNGGMIYDSASHKILAEEHLHPDAKQILIDMLDAFPKAAAEVLVGKKIYIVRSNEYELEHMRLLGVDYEECSIDEVPDGWIKILFATNSEMIVDMQNFTAERGYDTVDFVPSSDHYYEMLPKNVSKGSALKKIREIVGNIKIIAAGDYNNDIEMLSEADISVAVGNAQPEVKNSSDIVLESTNNDGIVKEIIKKALDFIPENSV